MRLALAERLEHTGSPIYYLVRKHRIAKLPTLIQLRDLPLHSKPVKSMNTDALMTDMLVYDAPRADRIHELWDIAAEAIKSQQQSVITQDHRMLMLSMHAQQMQRDGIISRINDAALSALGPVSFVKSFPVVEEHKQRLRQIHWPADALASSSYRSAFSLRSSAQIRDSIEDFKSCYPDCVAIVNDMRAGFYQISVPHSINYVAVDDSGACWRLSRLPMGLDVSPELLQLMLEYVIMSAIRETATQANVFFDVHIDNVLLLCTDASIAKKISTALVHRAKAWTISFEDPNFKTCTSFDHCGLVTDLRARTFNLRDTIVGHLKEFLNKLDRQQDILFTDLESAFGRLIFAEPIIRLRLFRYYFAFKLWRRLLSQARRGIQDMNGIVPVQARFRAELTDLLRQAVANEPSPFTETNDKGCDIHVYVDASVSGRGVVIFGLSQPYAKGVQWQADDWQSKHINMLEAVTVIDGLSFLREKLALENPIVRSVTVHIDNTSALATAMFKAKAESMRFIAPLIQYEIEALQYNHHVKPNFVWVSTHANFADVYSRSGAEPAHSRVGGRGALPAR